MFVIYRVYIFNTCIDLSLRLSNSTIFGILVIELSCTVIDNRIVIKNHP